VELVAVVDMQEGRARDYQSRFGAPKHYVSVEDALQDKAIEAVDLCLPPAAHCPVAVQSLESGRHVLVEKPMALTVAEADAMIAAAEENDVILMSGQSRRFNDPLMAAKELLDEGRIGKLIHISVASGGKSQSPPVWWWKDPSITGKSALMANWCSHWIDQMVWVAASEPVRVSAEAASYNDEFAGVDQIAMLIAFENGVMAAYQHTFNASFGDAGGFAYMGAEGTINLSGNKVFLNGETVDGVGTNTNNFTAEIREYTTAIREGRQPLASGREVRPTIAIMEAALKSAETHQTIHLGGV
jgi:predicted dehydrogenase